MQPKYFHAKAMERIRIPTQTKDVLEMHRNARIDYYDESITESIKEVLNLSKLNRYPDVEVLYDKLAAFHNIDSSNILLSSGIDGGLKAIFEMCTKPGSKIVCLTPTYGMYYVYANAFDTQMISIESSSEDLQIDINCILDAIDNSVDILFLPNPHEPIENILALEEIHTIVKKAKACDVLVCMDEAYYMFGAPTALPLIDMYDNLIVARTFSKGIGIPAIRLGYLIANAGLIQYLETKRFAHEVNSLTIDIALWALDNFTLLENYAHEVCETRNWLKEELLALGFKTHGSLSNTILIHLESEAEANRITDALQQRDIIVRGYLPKPVSASILVTMGKKEVVQKFLDAFLQLQVKH